VALRASPKRLKNDTLSTWRANPLTETYSIFVNSSNIYIYIVKVQKKNSAKFSTS